MGLLAIVQCWRCCRIERVICGTIKPLILLNMDTTVWTLPAIIAEIEGLRRMKPARHASGTGSCLARNPARRIDHLCVVASLGVCRPNVEEDLSEHIRRRAFSWKSSTGEAGTALGRAGLGSDPRLPCSGSCSPASFEDRTIVVKVLQNGFEYQSQPYLALSAAVREVTGTRWNGLRFFGLTGAA